LVSALQEVIDPPVLPLCCDSPRLTNTLAVETPCDAGRIQRAARNLVVATGQSETPADEMTRVLRAIGRTDAEIKRTLRISLGWTTSRDQIERAVDLLAEACDGLAAT
jgi:cysteine desulfurase